MLGFQWKVEMLHPLANTASYENKKNNNSVGVGSVYGNL